MQEDRQASPPRRFCEAAADAIMPRLAEMYAHEEGTRAGEDPEHLHDMRVASRRLRAAITVFAPCFPKRAYTPLSRAAARVTRALGAVRDDDVLLGTLAEYRADISEPEGPGIDGIVEATRAGRDAHRSAMLETLDAVDREGFRQRLQLLLVEQRARGGRGKGWKDCGTLREVAQRICVRRIADLYGFEPAVHDLARVEELHRMRIAAKRLRYSMEIFREVLGPKIEDRIDAVKTIQEKIGQIHDADVLIDLLQARMDWLAGREGVRLHAIAAEPGTAEERRARVQAALLATREVDPRLGVLVLLGRTQQERAKMHTGFVRWWDRHQANGLRAKFYDTVVTFGDPGPGQAEQA